MAEVKNSQQQVISRPKVGAPRPGKPVIVTVPSKLLPPGIYSLQLSGVLPDGTNEAVGNYSFRVTRKYSSVSSERWREAWQINIISYATPLD